MNDDHVFVVVNCQSVYSTLSHHSRTQNFLNSCVCRLFLFVVIEICWNIYPSNSASSVTLLVCHLTLLWGLWSAPSEYPHVREVENEIKSQ